MQEIYLDDYHLHSLTTRLATLVKQPLPGLENPEQRIDTFDNPGVAGQTVGNSLSGAGTIAIEGAVRWVSGTTDAERLADYLASRKALIAAIRTKTDATGAVQPFLLKLTDLDGSQYRVSVYKRKFVSPRELPAHNTWHLDLINPSGIIESETLTTATIALPTGGTLTYDVVYPVVYGSATGGAVTLTNTGTTDAAPTITLAGPLTNPVITNDTTGARLGLNLTIATGQVVVVTVGSPSTIVQGTAGTVASTNKMGAKTLGSTFWKLQPGANSIRLSADLYESGTAAISFRDAWEGL